MQSLRQLLSLKPLMTLLTIAIVFCRERNREMEIWNGYRAGIDGAIEEYEADEAYAIDLLDEEIIENY